MFTYSEDYQEIKMLRIGFGKRKITPPVGILMAGHLHEKRSNGVHDDLFARAILIEDSNTKIVVISCDLVLLENEFVKIIRGKIEKKCHIPQNHIFISTTHTHSGPLCAALLGAEAEESYESFLEEQIIGCVEIANNRLQPAKIGFSSTNINGLSFNRRFIMDDGTVETHPFKGNPHIVKAEGEVDPEIGVIYAVDLNNRFLGGIVNFACHATCIERRNRLISADFPGYIEKTFQQDIGSDVVVLFCNGACGNLCQVNVEDLNQREIGFPWAEYMGRRIAKVAIRAMRDTTPEADIKIATRSRTIRVPIRIVTQTQIKESQEILSQPLKKNEKLIKLSNYGTEGLNDKSVVSVEDIFQTQLWKRIQAKELLALAKEREKSEYAELEISVISLGNNAVVMVPVELFTEFGLEIKRLSKFEYTFVVELANGYAGYIPTAEAFQRKGGYETKLLRSSKLIPEAGDMIVKTVLELMKVIRRKLSM